MNKQFRWYRPWITAVVALLLFALTVGSRMPFVSRMLYAWDSANFALALQQYNVAFEQPHAPGYPLYVALAKLVDAVVKDPNASYVYISVVASGAAVAFLFLLAFRMYDFWIGLIAAVLMATSVGFWGYGEVAYPYPTLGLFGTLVAYLCYLMWQHHRSVGVLSGLVLGVAGGVRPDALVFLGPLWLASVWRTGLARFGASVVVLALVIASWTLSAVQLSGGWAAFQQASAAQSDYILSHYSVLYAGLDGVRRNTETLLLFLKQMGGLGLLVTLYFLGRFLTFKALIADHRILFLLLWLLPPVLVYILVHIGDPGYVLSLLPPVCIVTAAGIRDIALDFRSALVLLSGRYRWLGDLSRWAKGAGIALAAVMVLALAGWNANAFFTTAGPARLSEIRTIDGILAGQKSYVESFEPGSVVVLAKARFRQLKYYLPKYDVRLLYDEYKQGYLETRPTFQIPAGVSSVLVMDFGKRPTAFPGAAGGEITLASSLGRSVGLWKFDVRPGDTVQYGYDFFGVTSR